MTTAPTLHNGEHRFEAEPCPLDRALRGLYPGVSWKTLRRAIDSGKVSVDGQAVSNPKREVSPGSLIAVCMTTPRRKSVPKLSEDAVLYVDRQVVVVAKPAGLITMTEEDATPRGARPDTLVNRLSNLLWRRGPRQVPLGVVQRLDRETSGLLVFTRTTAAREHLKQQFIHRTIVRSYQALASGSVSSSTIRLRLVEQRDGQRTATLDPKMGCEAITHVEMLERLDGATLVRCRLETGRTHQIRIHLSEIGHPLLGEKRYTRRGVEIPTAPRVMLHAAELGFVHPVTEEPLHFEVDLPPDMAGRLEQLR